MQPLAPGQLWVMRIHGLFGIIPFLVPAFPAAVWLKGAYPDLAWLPFIPAALMAVYLLLLRPGRAWRAWGYRMDPRELHLRCGVITKVETVVPLARVQHIDIAQGPVERAFKVNRLMLHTAGTAHALVVLPGLPRETAEAIRDEIRTHIQSEAA